MMHPTEVLVMPQQVVTALHHASLGSGAGRFALVLTAEGMQCAVQVMARGTDKHCEGCAVRGPVLPNFLAWELEPWRRLSSCSQHLLAPGSFSAWQGSPEVQGGIVQSFNPPRSELGPKCIKN